MAIYTIETTPEQDAALLRYIEQENANRVRDGLERTASPVGCVEYCLFSWLNGLIRLEKNRAEAAFQRALLNATPEQKAAISNLLRDA